MKRKVFIESRNIRNICLFESILISTIMFFLFYGFKALNPCYDAWLSYAYAEADNIQHYAGWIAFRNSKWTFPLGHIDCLSYPVGTQVSFMDSIPILAILFKAISSILPDTFQYFGWYIFLCVFLQAFCGNTIFRLFEGDEKVIFLQTFLITTSPILYERAFRHCALASHYLILFSLYIYFYGKKKSRKKYEYGFAVLMIIAVLTHPYFLPMVFAIMLATLADGTIYEGKTYLLYAIKVFVISLMLVFLCIYCFGIFNAGTGLLQGYGMFHMNLNALVNPISTNSYQTAIKDITYHWSSIIPPLKQMDGDYDGFMFLGCGIILGLIFVILGFIKTRKERKILNRNYLCLYILVVLLTLYAISNVITVNGYKFTIPIPTFIYKICSIFAASSRIFYPVYYLIYIVILLEIPNIYEIFRIKIEIWKNRTFDATSRVGCGILLSIILFIQLFDMKDIIIVKHDYFADFDIVEHDAPLYDNIFDEEFWDAGYRYLWIDSYYRTGGYGLALNCAKNNIVTNEVVNNRFSDDDIKQVEVFSSKIFTDLVKGVYDKKSIYAITDENTLNICKVMYSDKAEFVEKNVFTLMVPK